MSLTIEKVVTPRQLQEFITFPWKIYQNDPVWVPPLIAERKALLNQKKNPFFEHAEGEYFLAKKNGKTLGRITAHVDHLHNERHQERTGFFGFFESINDPEVAEALLHHAESWMRGKGLKHIRGPFNFSINEECGFLAKGFETPPALMNPHSPPYYLSLMERAGYSKAKDLYCWRYDSTQALPEAALQISEAVRQHPGLSIRSLDKKHMRRDLQIIMDIFNEAWEQNWGFVPLTSKEVDKAAKDFKPFLEPDLALIAEVDGEPAGMALSIPNLNEATRDLNGKLFPFGFLKLLYRIKTRKIRSARMMLLGIRRKFRGSVLGGLSVLLNTQMHLNGLKLGFKQAELSWTLEDNDRVNQGIQFMGGVHYKTYRIFEKSLSAGN